MSEPENFLERWSRKKAESERDVPAAHEQRDIAVDQLKSDTTAASPSVPATSKPEFDIASLPSLESITKATDIRVFLAPGVPAHLTRAALRRAWTADPAIRDFVGLQENDWDFTNPDAIPGFGDIAPHYDVKKLLAQLFNEPEGDVVRADATRPAVPQDAQPAKIVAESDAPVNSSEATPSGEPDGNRSPVTTMALSDTDFVQRNNDNARNGNSEVQMAERTSRRQHGGALPE
jgi:Protein of unknown function (DUF3306)